MPLPTLPDSLDRLSLSPAYQISPEDRRKLNSLSDRDSLEKTINRPNTFSPELVAKSMSSLVADANSQGDLTAPFINPVLASYKLRDRADIIRRFGQNQYELGESSPYNPSKKKLVGDVAKTLALTSIVSAPFLASMYDATSKELHQIAAVNNMMPPTNKDVMDAFKSKLSYGKIALGLTALGIAAKGIDSAIKDHMYRTMVNDSFKRLSDPNVSEDEKDSIAMAHMMGGVKQRHETLQEPKYSILENIYNMFGNKPEVKNVVDFLSRPDPELRLYRVN